MHYLKINCTDSCASKKFCKKIVINKVVECYLSVLELYIYLYYSQKRQKRKKKKIKRKCLLFLKRALFIIKDKS